ncbi:MAG: hypothetical protein B6I25_07955, partial [Planctomycetales bacterium 4572_13]
FVFRVVAAAVGRFNNRRGDPFFMFRSYAGPEFGNNTLINTEVHHYRATPFWICFAQILIYSEARSSGYDRPIKKAAALAFESNGLMI